MNITKRFLQWQVGRGDWVKGFQGGSMYFYIDGFYARGEDPRNRKMSDVYFIIYKPSGRPGQIACNCCVQLESELTPNVAQQS